MYLVTVNMRQQSIDYDSVYGIIVEINSSPCTVSLSDILQVTCQVDVYLTGRQASECQCCQNRALFSIR
jgi:hypothetical protein